MALLTVDEARTYARVAPAVDDALLAELIAAALQWVEETIGQPAEARTLIEELDGGDLFLRPAWGEITSIACILDKATNAIEESDDYDHYPDAIFRLRGGIGPSCAWSPGGKRYRVTYTAVSPNTATIRRAVLMLVARWYDQRGGERSSGALGMSTSWGELAGGEVAQLLDPIRRVAL